MAKIMGLAHIGIFVKDLKRSLKFYNEVLDFDTRWECEMSDENNSYKIAIINKGSVAIELVEMKIQDERSSESVIAHVAMQVDDIEGMIESLKAKGIEFETKEPVHGKEMLENGSKWIFFRGPDNEHLELAQIL